MVSAKRDVGVEMKRETKYFLVIILAAVAGLVAINGLLRIAVSPLAEPANFFGLDLNSNTSQGTAATGHARLRYDGSIVAMSVATGSYSEIPTAASTTTLTNKTITSPVFSGTATGTYTLGGTPTLTAPTWTGTSAGTLMKPIRIANNSGTPSIAVGAAAQLGTTPAASIAGGDVGGNFTLTTGTGPSAFTAGLTVTLGTITWNSTFSAAPKGVPSHPCNTNAALLATGANGIEVFIDQATCTTTQCTVKMSANGTPTLAASTAYQFCYTVIQ